ncbi:DAO-domain-containing protein [Nadsonia fulvescens var. elongata DSM 6958]|uniref:Glycerol-3-phosphate dehydrogenase n=1 Tax=Nadsonia fulvescens var. elongata DSM 6958 TaxID=857566 RepID=A0A1E3PQP2_9ASCO|nr:DAO-domain-containing protein [Nadsonia fulvescens var. elongata DSM 6958]
MFRSVLSSQKRALSALAAVTTTVGIATYYSSSLTAHADTEFKHPTLPPVVNTAPRSRQHMLNNMKSATPEKPYDVVIIGGGATGTGIALDAVSRGLKVALLERDDFSSGTSSKSTKLVHGGVRYLEKAFWSLDYSQYALVKEALHERSAFLTVAPHLSFALPILIPVYTWWQLPYFWVGCKAYDLLAGSQNLASSYLMGKKRTTEVFPMLNDTGLKGSLVYYDGSQNDSRMNVSLAITAIEKGADILNHIQVVELIKDNNGKVNGVVAQDLESGSKTNIAISSKSVINATGPYCDSIRQLDDLAASAIVAPSSGVHIVLPSYYSSPEIGLLDPATSDGRVIFFLPWQGRTIAGTTDTPAKVEHSPVPAEEDIEFILNEIRGYMKGKLEVRREDVLAAWSGIRPLVRDPKAKNTESLVRNHLITYSDSGMMTISGGKWTTYRQMAEEAVDSITETFNLATPLASKAITANLKLVGAENWNNFLFISLLQNYNLTPDVAKHLSSNYGDRATTVLSFVKEKDSHPALLDENYPYLEAEIDYAVQYEYATTAVDVLCRRTRLGFLDVRAAKKALPKVINVMGQQLNWSNERKASELSVSLEYLKTMGL